MIATHGGLAHKNGHCCSPYLLWCIRYAVHAVSYPRFSPISPMLARWSCTAARAIASGSEIKRKHLAISSASNSGILSASNRKALRIALVRWLLRLRSVPESPRQYRPVLEGAEVRSNAQAPRPALEHGDLISFNTVVLGMPSTCWIAVGPPVQVPALRPHDHSCRCLPVLRISCETETVAVNKMSSHTTMFRYQPGFQCCSGDCVWWPAKAFKSNMGW